MFKLLENVVYADLPDPYLRYDQITNNFVLLQPLVTPEVTVPAGDYTDGASRPEFVDMFVKRYDRHFVPCIVHDYMYRHAIVLPGYEHDPKAGADALFEVNLYRCSKLYGYPAEKIPAMVAGVKSFGRGAYGSKCYYSLECDA